MNIYIDVADKLYFYLTTSLRVILHIKLIKLVTNAFKKLHHIEIKRKEVMKKQEYQTIII